MTLTEKISRVSDLWEELDAAAIEINCPVDVCVGSGKLAWLAREKHICYGGKGSDYEPIIRARVATKIGCSPLAGELFKAIRLQLIELEGGAEDAAVLLKAALPKKAEVRA